MSHSYLLQDTKTRSIISETSNKIDTEIASLKTLMESNKLETIRYLAGKVILYLVKKTKFSVVKLKI